MWGPRRRGEGQKWRSQQETASSKCSSSNATEGGDDFPSGHLLHACTCRRTKGTCAEIVAKAPSATPKSLKTSKRSFDLLPYNRTIMRNKQGRHEEIL